MTIGEFSEKHKLKLVSERVALRTTLHPDGDPHPDCEHVPGKRGWIVEAGSAFDVFVKSHYVGSLMAQAKEIGMEVSCHGDRELGLHFDPENTEQAKFAIQIIKARRRRQVKATPEVLERLRKAREARRMPVAA